MSPLRLTVSAMNAPEPVSCGSAFESRDPLRTRAAASRQSCRSEAAKVRQLFGDLAADKTKQPCARSLAFPCMKHICYKPGHRCLHIALPALGVARRSRRSPGVLTRRHWAVPSRGARLQDGRLPTQQHGDVLAAVEPRQGPVNQICAGSKADGRLESCQSPSKLAGSMWRARCSQRDTSSRRRHGHALQQWQIHKGDL